MSSQYFPSETHTIWLQILRRNNTVPDFGLGDYTAPKVRVYHQESGVLTEDVALITMTQLADNVWYHDFDVPATPFFGDYISEFQSTIDGSDVEVSETFKVTPPPDIVEEGQGSCEITGCLRNESTSDPIPGATVYIFDPADLLNAVAKSITDLAGNWTVYLNPDDYKIRFTKIGFIDETHDMVVNANCTYTVIGD